jgi:hypothetical protein
MHRCSVSSTDSSSIRFDLIPMPTEIRMGVQYEGRKRARSTGTAFGNDSTWVRLFPHVRLTGFIGRCVCHHVMFHRSFFLPSFGPSSSWTWTQIPPFTTMSCTPPTPTWLGSRFGLHSDAQTTVNFGSIYTLTHWQWLAWWKNGKLRVTYLLLSPPRFHYCPRSGAIVARSRMKSRSVAFFLSCSNSAER